VEISNFYWRLKIEDKSLQWVMELKLKGLTQGMAQREVVHLDTGRSQEQIEELAKNCEKGEL
jgi:hypothetical protein